jgi:hypothetical protein
MKLLNISFERRIRGDNIALIDQSDCMTALVHLHTDRNLNIERSDATNLVRPSSTDEIVASENSSASKNHPLQQSPARESSWSHELCKVELESPRIRRLPRIHGDSNSTLWSSLLHELFLAGDCCSCLVTMTTNSSPSLSCSGWFLPTSLFSGVLTLAFPNDRSFLTNPKYTNVEDQTLPSLAQDDKYLDDGASSITQQRERPQFKRETLNPATIKSRKHSSASTTSRGKKMLAAISEQKKLEQCTSSSDNTSNSLSRGSNATTTQSNSLIQMPMHLQATEATSRKARSLHRTKTWTGVRDDIKGINSGRNSSISYRNRSQMIDESVDAETCLSDDESFKSCNSGLPDDDDLDDDVCSYQELKSMPSEHRTDEESTSMVVEEPCLSASTSSKGNFSASNDFNGEVEISQFYVSPDDNHSTMQKQSTSRSSYADSQAKHRFTANEEKSPPVTRLFDIVMNSSRPQDPIEASSELHSSSSSSSSSKALAQLLRDDCSKLPSVITDTLESCLLSHKESPHTAGLQIYNTFLEAAAKPKAKKSKHDNQSNLARSHSKHQKELLRSLEKLTRSSEISLAESIAAIMIAVELLLHSSLSAPADDTSRSADVTGVTTAKLTQLMDKLGILLVMNNKLSKDELQWLDLTIEACAGSQSNSSASAISVSTSHIAAAIRRHHPFNDVSSSILAAYLPPSNLQSIMDDIHTTMISASTSISESAISYAAPVDQDKDNKVEKSSSLASNQNPKKRCFPWRGDHASSSDQQESESLPSAVTSSSSSSTTTSTNVELEHSSIALKPSSSSTAATSTAPRSVIDKLIDGSSKRHNSLLASTSQSHRRNGLTYGHRLRMGGSKQILMPAAKPDIALLMTAATSSSSYSQSNSNHGKRQRISPTIVPADENFLTNQKDLFGSISSRTSITRMQTYPSLQEIKPLSFSSTIAAKLLYAPIVQAPRRIVQDTPQGKINKIAPKTIFDDDDSRGRTLLSSPSPATRIGNQLVVEGGGAWQVENRSNHPVIGSQQSMTKAAGIAMRGRSRSDDRGVTSMPYISSDIFL